MYLCFPNNSQIQRFGRSVDSQAEEDACPSVILAYREKEGRYRDGKKDECMSSKITPKFKRFGGSADPQAEKDAVSSVILKDACPSVILA